jgi:hypothetical protein
MRSDVASRQMRARIAGRPARDAKLPSERAWQRSRVVEPRLAARHPAFVSDGGSPPFPPAALLARATELDAADAAVEALVSLLLAQGVAVELRDWRTLVQTEDEALFARGSPPHLALVTVRRDARRDRWIAGASSSEQPLVATRDGIRASAWRLDPLRHQQTLRLLVTERAFASGQSADRRILPPDIYLGEDEIILTVYVKPRPGFQTGSRNPETPVRVALPEAVGGRVLTDGALVPQGLN